LVKWEQVKVAGILRRLVEGETIFKSVIIIFIVRNGHDMESTGIEALEQGGC
jgi:hypothetical protein